jgi:crotonobetaine/carnitine-CoA ligase
MSGVGRRVPIPSWAEDYEAHFGHPIKELYGIVEVSIQIVQTGERVPGSCGKVLPGYNIRIADDSNAPLPLNTPGNLLVRADSPNAFFNGYFKYSEKPLESMRNLWFHRGDLAKVDEADNLFFLRRTKMYSGER